MRVRFRAPLSPLRHGYEKTVKVMLQCITKRARERGQDDDVTVPQPSGTKGGGVWSIIPANLENPPFFLNPKSPSLHRHHCFTIVSLSSHHRANDLTIISPTLGNGPDGEKVGETMVRIDGETTVRQW